MIIFSLNELERIFGRVNFKQIRKINFDLKEIRESYREKFGFFKTLHLTNKKIFRAFFIYHLSNECTIYEVGVWQDWEEFVDRCIECTDFTLFE